MTSFNTKANRRIDNNVPSDFTLGDIDLTTGLQVGRYYKENTYIVATYEYRSWETINLPAVSNDTYYKILDHSSNTPGTETTGVIYEGVVLKNYSIEALDEVLSQYVSPVDIKFVTGVTEDNQSHATFYIYYTTDDWATFTYDIIIITYDWSYKSVARSVLSQPITNILSPNQYFVHTVTPATPDVVTDVTLTIDGEQVLTKQISGYTRYTFEVYLPDAIRNLPSRSGDHVLIVGSSRFIIPSDDCGVTYILYYLNELGGWDFLSLRGSSLRSADISRLQYEKRVVSRGSNFATVDYLTTISDRWSLNTSYLDDSGAQKMINLLASNRVYLHDLSSNTIIPVNVTNQSCDYKTYANQGHNFAAYTIEVTASSKKYRV